MSFNHNQTYYQFPLLPGEKTPKIITGTYSKCDKCKQNDMTTVISLGDNKYSYTCERCLSNIIGNSCAVCTRKKSRELCTKCLRLIIERNRELAACRYPNCKIEKCPYCIYLC